MDNTITANINRLTQEERNQLISKSKKKRKFRTMTNAEFCNKHKYCSACPEYKGDMNRCYLFMHGIASIEPYRTLNGKYILVELIEVKK